ncbi:YdbH domain-containing protein [Sphingomonas sp. HHU CXW]|uniref:YdbH domain-containing protein n=1 Tax=Sphingomonas hominis TaxID=2741495 RepID=A0ABX2JIR2_9SPHN|nr:YdbH domain-containing protein [Sphingomonas hominis]NTS63730.1 YdbH domain-containing protein [Sphingomonas hominis]
MSGERRQEQAQEQAASSPARRRRTRVLVAGSVLVVAGVGGVWLSRVPIATRVIDRELARKGVRARYHVADLGLGRQRLTDVVIGDPARPDLVADWIETQTDVGFGGARLIAARAGHVRVRGRLVDGRLSLGALDRLLPRGDGGALTLPALDVSIADGGLRLETPFGIAGMSLSGRGRLDGGFRGRYAVAANRLARSDCAVLSLRAAGQLRSTGRVGEGVYGLHLDGPARAERLACAGASIDAPSIRADATVMLGALARSRIDATIATGEARYADARAATLAGTLALRPGVAGSFDLPLDLAATRVRQGQVSAARIGVSGKARVAPAGIGYAGQVAVRGGDLRALLPALRAGEGTPVAPLVARAADAARRAARDVSAQAQLALVRTDAGVSITLDHAALTSASGARARLDAQPSLRWTATDGIRGVGTLRVAGGGLPQLAARFAQAERGALTGSASLARYAADGAALALDRIRFDARGGAVRATAQATLSGPLADGRVDGLSVPLDLRWARGALLVNPTCTPVRFDALRVSTLRLDPTRLTLCPAGAALVQVRGGRADGTIRLPATRLAGTIGSTPLRLNVAGADLSLGTRGFALRGVETRIGTPARQTRIDAARLTGTLVGNAIAGGFAGLSGQIANVPLLLGDGAGTWRFANGTLAVQGALRVRDAADSARFNPMDARDVALTLQRGDIRATATLFEPTRSVKVADVAIDHRLSTGAGRAALTVPGITFGEGFQPELITPLTFGVIADVRGRVTGRGDIAWNADGVSSTGTFSTTDTALAAAFGPVEGLSGTIRFTDLLGLTSAPDQVATVRSINPGVPVTDGRITYQTLPNTRIKVTRGTWPFAGGTLTLEPTLLDFSSAQERRLTFRVAGMDAGAFLQQFDFDNLNATGTFDGVLPMIFDATGGRIEGGRLTARAGGGGIAYVGELSEKNLGFWGNYAFQMLKSLTYRNLDIGMNGPLAGEMITDVRFAGIGQGAGARSNFLIRRLTKLPILFNIRVRAPFRGLIDSAASFYDPQRLVARNLQQLIEEQNRRTAPIGSSTGASPTTKPLVPPIQPSASEIVP